MFIIKTNITRIFKIFSPPLTLFIIKANFAILEFSKFFHLFFIALKEMGDHSWTKENNTEKASVYYTRAVHKNNHPEVTSSNYWIYYEISPVFKYSIIMIFFPGVDFISIPLFPKRKTSFLNTETPLWISVIQFFKDSH